MGMPPIWECWNKLHDQNEEYFDMVKQKWMFPHILRLRSSQKNLDTAAEAAGILLTSHWKLAAYYLWYNIEWDKYTEFLNNKQELDEKTKLAKEYLQHKYNWSDREFYMHEPIIADKVNNETFVEDLDQYAGLPEDEADVFGIEQQEMTYSDSNSLGKYI